MANDVEVSKPSADSSAPVASRPERTSGVRDSLRGKSYSEGRKALQLKAGPGPSEWTVAGGDTLWGIAERTLGNGSAWGRIWQLNEGVLPNPHNLRIGMVLRLPGGQTGAPAPAAAPAPTHTAPPPGTYTVKPGDTLSGIAGKVLHDASQWRAIYEANRDRIANPNVIRVGQVLRMPGGDPNAAGPDATPEPAPAPPAAEGGMAPGGKKAVGSSPLEQQMAEIYNSKGKFVAEQAGALGVEPAVAAACLSVESGGSGYVGGKLKIRFESHIFKDQSGGHSVSVNHTGSQADEYDALERAKAVNRGAAYRSISMGAGQIMGFNAARIGFGSAEAMFDEFQKSLASQLGGMFTFIRTSNVLLKAARNKDWGTFAYYYNGAGYAANAYDTKLAGAYHAYVKVTHGLPYG